MRSVVEVADIDVDLAEGEIGSGGWGGAARDDTAGGVEDGVFVEPVAGVAGF